MDEFVAMLAEDAIQSMPPWEEWFVGRAVLRSIYANESGWGGPPRPGRFRVSPVRLNGQQAFAEYTRQESGVPYNAFCLTVMTATADGSKIAELTSFIQPELFEAFGLPMTLPADP